MSSTISFAKVVVKPSASVQGSSWLHQVGCPPPRTIGKEPSVGSLEVGSLGSASTQRGYILLLGRPRLETPLCLHPSFLSMRAWLPRIFLRWLRRAQRPPHPWKSTQVSTQATTTCGSSPRSACPVTPLVQLSRSFQPGAAGHRAELSSAWESTTSSRPSLFGKVLSRRGPMVSGVVWVSS